MIGADPDEKIGSAWTITAQLALSAADAADDHVRIKLDEDLIKALTAALCWQIDRADDLAHKVFDVLRAQAARTE